MKTNITQTNQFGGDTKRTLRKFKEKKVKDSRPGGRKRFPRKKGNGNVVVVPVSQK